MWHLVASFAEAWIEILLVNYAFFSYNVASFAEAWIEIVNCVNIGNACPKSPPSRRRGLKYVPGKVESTKEASRLLRGGVD